MVFYSSFFYKYKIKCNIKTYNKCFRLVILLLPLERLGERTCTWVLIPILLGLLNKSGNYTISI